MKVDLMILNVMKYQKDGESKSRLGYIIIEPTAFVDSEKFKGYSELSSYSNDTKFYDLIPIEFIGQRCKAEIVEKSSPQNPLKTYKEIGSIECNGKTIHLV